MKNFVVLYRCEEIMSPLDSPFGFQCYADDADHAEEQCLNSYPGADVVWVWEGPFGCGMQPALDDYYSQSHLIQSADVAAQREASRRDWAQRNGNDSGFDPYAGLEAV